MKIKFIVFLSLVSIVGFSQTITQAFNEPVIGEVDTNFKLDTSAYSNGLPLNISGTGVTWDFSNLAGMFPVIIDSIISPAVAVSNSLYPAATYCQHRDVIYSYYKSSTSPSQTELLGAYSPSLTLTFTNSAIIAAYPVSYGYSLTDVVSGSFKFGTNNGACNGSITVIADATGTLNFPNGNTFNNVLRLRSVEELTMSSGFFPLGTISQYIYSYYIPTKKYPLLTIQYQKYQLLTGTPTITTLAYGNSNYFSVAGLGSTQPTVSDYKLMPNPFCSELNLHAENFNDVIDFKVYSLTGQMILGAKNTKEILEAYLPPGAYQLEIRTIKGSVFQRIVRE